MRYIPVIYDFLKDVRGIQFQSMKGPVNTLNHTKCGAGDAEESSVHSFCK